MTKDSTTTIFVPLCDEGTPTLRPTQGIPLEKDLYKILPTPNYDPEDETWEFLPGAVVRCDEIISLTTGKKILRANAVRNDDGSFTLSNEFSSM